MLHYCCPFFKHFGIPIAVDKLEGPYSIITFFGIELDTIQGINRLPTQVTELNYDMSRKEVMFETGPGIINRQNTTCLQSSPTRLDFSQNVWTTVWNIKENTTTYTSNHAFRSDLMWWHTFLGSWNRKAMMHRQDQWIPAVQIYTDAVGCGAWWWVHWLQLKRAKAAT